MFARASRSTFPAGYDAHSRPGGSARMEVRIGVVYSAKELTVDIESSPEQIGPHAQKAPAESAHLLGMHDDRGRRIGIPLDKIAYVELAVDDENRRVGF